MDLANNMFFFRICDGTESLIRDSECLYIEHLIKEIGSTRANCIRALADWCFIYMDIDRHLLFAVVKEVGERWFEEESSLFLSTNKSKGRFGYSTSFWLPHNFSSKSKTTQFYLKNKASLMQWLSDFDYGRGGDRSIESLANALLFDSVLEHSDLTENDIVTFFESSNESGDNFTCCANALVLMVYKSICSSIGDVLDIDPSLSVRSDNKSVIYGLPTVRQVVNHSGASLVQ